MDGLTSPSRKYRKTFAAGVVALATGAVTALVGVAPAQADTEVAGGSLHWGFKQSFRNYVGNQTAALPPIGALPVGERITLTAPATFDPADPAVPTTVEEAKRPYIFAAESGEAASETDVEIQAAGGVSFNFPSHYFQIQINNPRVVVAGDTATIYADTVYDVSEDFGDFKAGFYENDNVPIAVSDSAEVVVTDDSATITATNVTLTEQGAEAVPLYSAGDALDDFTASAELEDPGPPAPNGGVTVSQTIVEDGTTVTVTGSGFHPSVLGTRPPLSGKPGGAYVVFGKFLDTWQPSAGAPSSARAVKPTAEGGQKWAVLAEDMATIGGDAAGAIELKPDGTFTAQVTITKEWGSITEDSPGNYGIYTYGGSGANHAGYETFTPISIVPAPDGQVEVSKNEVRDGRTVTVTGTGFSPTVLGTRPPLSGQPAGVYVVFGKFLDTWKPSAGAPGSARPGLPAADGGTKWAVLSQFIPSPISPAAGGIVLNPDGTFTAEVKVQKEWGSITEDSPGNYGIYTYAGSGAAAAGYETFTPITVLDPPSVPTATIEAGNRAYGKASNVTVTLTPPDGVSDDLAADVTFTGAGAAQTKALVGGKATFTLAKNLKPGTYTLTAVYPGNDDYDGAEATATVKITKAGVAKPTWKVNTKPTPKKKGKATVTVKSNVAGAPATGKATITLKKGKVTKTVTVTLKNGKATKKLPKLAKGNWKVKIKYAGTATHKAATSKTYTITIK